MASGEEMAQGGTAGVRRSRANEARLRVEDIDQMEAALHIAEVAAKDVKSTCNIFCVPEIFKLLLYKKQHS